MSLLDTMFLWGNAHRTVLTLFVAFLLWGSAYGLYFRRIGVKFINRRKPHSWQIDMVTKTAMRGSRPDINGGKKLM